MLLNIYSQEIYTLKLYHISTEKTTIFLLTNEVSLKNTIIEHDKRSLFAFALEKSAERLFRYTYF